MSEQFEQDDREMVGDAFVIGPDCILSADENVIAYRGENFYRSPAPRQVGTVAELDALPVETVFRDRNGETWVIQDDTQGYAAYSSAWGNEVLQTVTFERRGLFPLLVLWVPDTEGSEE